MTRAPLGRSSNNECNHYLRVSVTYLSSNKNLNNVKVCECKGPYKLLGPLTQLTECCPVSGQVETVLGPSQTSPTEPQTPRVAVDTYL